MEKNRLQNIVISYNIPLNFLNELLIKATQSNLLIISFGDSEDMSKYENVPSTFSIETISEGLEDLPNINDESKKCILLQITIPIQSKDLEKLLNSL